MSATDLADLGVGRAWIMCDELDAFLLGSPIRNHDHDPGNCELCHNLAVLFIYYDNLLTAINEYRTIRAADPEP